jgi:hypothetical protein
MGTLPKTSVRSWLERVRTRLEALLPSLRTEFPSVTFGTFGGPVGSVTEFQGHDVGLEASFPSGDCVALVASAAYLTTEPRVSADVSWNAEADGGVEASTWQNVYSSKEWPHATSQNLEQIDRELPRLVESLRAAIAQYLTAVR